MKSNDIAGIGNFNTAEFWEYNTRTGRRQNLDPVPQVSMSDYSVMGGNPIANNDVLGDRYDRPNSVWQRAVNELTGNGHINKAYDFYKKEKEKHYAVYSVVGDEAIVTTDVGNYSEGGRKGQNQEVTHFTEKSTVKEYRGSDKYVRQHPMASVLSQAPNTFTFVDYFGASTSKLKLASVLSSGRAAAKEGGNYLYHYTSREAAQSISQQGLKVGRDGFSYLTNKGNLSGIQAQIELALPINRALPNTILKIDVTGMKPTMIRRVTGNMPGFGAGGGTEFLFNKTIPADRITIMP